MLESFWVPLITGRLQRFLQILRPEAWFFLFNCTLKLSHVTSDWLHWSLRVCLCAVYGRVCGVLMCSCESMPGTHDIMENCIYSAKHLSVIRIVLKFPGQYMYYFQLFFFFWCVFGDDGSSFANVCRSFETEFVFFIFCCSECHRQLLKLISEEGARYTASGHLHLLRASSTSLHSAVPAAWALQPRSGASGGGISRSWWSLVNICMN